MFEDWVMGVVGGEVCGVCWLDWTVGGACCLLLLCTCVLLHKAHCQCML